MLSLPDRPVMSDLDPDAMGILCRNLIDNALRHGASDRPVEVTLSTAGTLRVANDGHPVSPDTLTRLTSRFERGNAGPGGSGLGLAIVAALAERLGSKLILQSPRQGQEQGFEVSISLPLDGSPPAPLES
jgi:two-component system OmpR family sensor kinase